MCGGFTCSRNSLIVLNIFYILVAFILIGVALYGGTASIVTNLPIVGGILACGIILILISVLGIAGAAKHQQVILFFYMVILFALFLIQFAVACACLGVNSAQQELLAEQGWGKVDNATRAKVQEDFGCCGFDGIKPIEVPCDQKLPPCMMKLRDTISHAFKLCGSIGLLFSFTEFIGVLLTVRYRNQKDPRANPSAFL